MLILVRSCRNRVYNNTTAITAHFGYLVFVNSPYLYIDKLITNRKTGRDRLKIKNKPRDLLSVAELSFFRLFVLRIESTVVEDGEGETV